MVVQTRQATSKVSRKSTLRREIRGLNKMIQYNERPKRTAVKVTKRNVPKPRKVKRAQSPRKMVNKKGNKPKKELTKSKKSYVEDKYECFLCFDSIVGDPNTFNSHIEECLIKYYELLSQPHLEEEDENTFQLPDSTYEEYEWAGQTRVRASTFLEGSLGGGNFTTVKKSNDIDEDLDIDMVEELQYGEVQFNENDLKPLYEQGQAPREERDTGYEEDVNPPDSKNIINQEEGDEVKGGKDLNNTINSQRIVIESLKQKIHDLQRQSNQKEKIEHNCLICQDAYQEPLVSTGCWHVHCRKCWLHTLSVKKLCPQCQRITFPTELRRIYI